MKVIENLKTVETGRRVAISPRMNFVTRIAESDVSIKEAILVRSTMTFEMNQIVPDRSKMPHAHDRAKVVMSREIYGEVIERLRDIREQLWENGPRYDDNILESVEQLIADLTL